MSLHHLKLLPIYHPRLAFHVATVRLIKCQQPLRSRCRSQLPRQAGVGAEHSIERRIPRKIYIIHRTWYAPRRWRRRVVGVASATRPQTPPASRKTLASPAELRSVAYSCRKPLKHVVRSCGHCYSTYGSAPLDLPIAPSSIYTKLPAPAKKSTAPTHRRRRRKQPCPGRAL